MPPERSSLPGDVFAGLFDRMTRIVAETWAEVELGSVARVLSVGNGSARIAGIPELRADELLSFASGKTGIAASLATDRAGVMVLGRREGIRRGDKVHRLRRAIGKPVGGGLLGCVVDALGQQLGGRRRVRERAPIKGPAPPIIQRAPAVAPFQTGIEAVDAPAP